MKKFYFLMMALLVSIGASAMDYQLIGNLNSWNTSDASTKFTAVGDGTYTLTVGKLVSGFKVKSFQADWDDTYNWGAPAGATQITVGTAMDLVVGNAGKDITVAAPIENATLIFNPSVPSLIIKGEQGNPDDVVISYCLHGYWEGDDSNWSDVTLTEKDGVWTASKEIPAKCNFGIKRLEDGIQAGSDNWVAAANASDAVVVLNKDIACSFSGTNFEIAAGTYTFAFNPTAMTLKVTGEGDEPDPQPQPTNPFQLHGQITGNANWETIDLTKNAEGNWTYTGSFVAGEFGIREVDGSEYGHWIGGAATITEADKAYSFVDGANSTSELEGNFTFVYNPTAKTVTFVPAGEIEEVITYALRGTIVTGEWNDYAMTESNGAWTVTLDVVAGEFGIKKMINGAERGWFSAPSEAEANVAEAGVYTAAGIGGTNWASTLEGKYIFSFNPETEKLTITKDTVGIEAVEAEEGVEAVYYNLQGVRVANPENGMYIRVAGKTASKVYIR